MFFCLFDIPNNMIIEILLPFHGCVVPTQSETTFLFECSDSFQNIGGLIVPAHYDVAMIRHKKVNIGGTREPLERFQENSFEALKNRCRSEELYAGFYTSCNRNSGNSAVQNGWKSMSFLSNRGCLLLKPLIYKTIRGNTHPKPALTQAEACGYRDLRRKSRTTRTNSSGASA